MHVSESQAVRQLRSLARQGRAMRLAADGWKSRFQTLIAIIMSARTRDETTIRVAQELFRHYPNARSLAHASLASVLLYVHPVNFFRNKTRSVFECARALDQTYNGVPPHDINKLILLPGVGRKTANVFLAHYGTDAIGVDTHVAYISWALGWSRHHNPHKIEIDLEKLFPRRLWRNVNEVCVRFGKTYMSRKKRDILLAGVRSL